jgi:hypothetical protein
MSFIPRERYVKIELEVLARSCQYGKLFIQQPDRFYT